MCLLAGGTTSELSPLSFSSPLVSKLTVAGLSFLSPTYSVRSRYPSPRRYLGPQRDERMSDRRDYL